MRARSVDTSSPELSESDAARVAMAAEMTALVAPLVGGSQLSASTVEDIHLDEWGTGVALVKDDAGRMFRLDICARDGNPGVEPLAQTSRFEIYVRNGGDGNVASGRETVLAARALAGVISSNEGSVDVSLVSKREYWSPGYFG